MPTGRVTSKSPSQRASSRTRNIVSVDKRHHSNRPRVPRSPPASSSAASKVMRANRARGTGPEIALRTALRGIGIRGFRTNVKGMPGRPDLAFPRERVAIFVNGCFWHQHGCAGVKKALPRSNRVYWELKFELNRERDIRKCLQLSANGWEVLTVWECELEQDPGACAASIASLLDDSVHRSARSIA